MYTWKYQPAYLFSLYCTPMDVPSPTKGISSSKKSLKLCHFLVRFLMHGGCPPASITQSGLTTGKSVHGEPKSRTRRSIPPSAYSFKHYGTIPLQTPGLKIICSIKNPTQEIARQWATI